MNGVTIEFDPDFQKKIVQEASDRLASNREWFKPGTDDELALHLSDLISCTRSRWYKYRDMDKKIRSGLSIASTLTPAQVIRFGRGYGFQDIVVGSDVEEAIWDDVHELYYSPDGGIKIPTEVKTSLAGPMVKKEREAGLSYEDILNGGGLRDSYYTEAVNYWKEYMLGVIYLERDKGRECEHCGGPWDHYHLIVAHWMSEELLTYRITPTKEAVDKNWEWMKNRLDILKRNEIPSTQTRRSIDECKRCDFLERCIGEGVLNK